MSACNPSPDPNAALFPKRADEMTNAEHAERWPWPPVSHITTRPGPAAQIEEARDRAPRRYLPRGTRAPKWARVRAALLIRPCPHFVLRKAGGGDGEPIPADTLADFERGGLIERWEGLWRITEAGRAAVLRVFEREIQQ